MLQEPIQLAAIKPFSMGGNRLCFVHPNDPNCCLKVFQERGEPKERRRRKGWIGFIRPLSTYDENLQEYLALTSLHKQFNYYVTQHIPKTKGLLQTDLGRAHAMQLIRDADGKISQTLEQYIWEHGLDQVAKAAISEFAANWIKGAPLTRELLPHNLLIHHSSSSAKLMLVDGFGRRSKRRIALPFKSNPQQKYLLRLDQRINEVLKRKSNGSSPKKRIGQLLR